jgi:hypothetical protein
VLHYANGRPTEATWRQFLLEQPATSPAPDSTIFGIASFDQLVPILIAFRDLLARLVRCPTVRAAESSDVRAAINERARPSFLGWSWVRGTGRLFARLETEDLTFEQSLYAQLGVAMQEAAFTVIKQCGSCERFFYEPRRKKARYCSVSCRDAAAHARVRRYREADPNRYRDYQRRLMAQRRREGKS